MCPLSNSVIIFTKKSNVIKFCYWPYLRDMPPQTSMPGVEVRDGHSHQDLPHIRPLTSEIRWTETLVA